MSNDLFDASNNPQQASAAAMVELVRSTCNCMERLVALNLAASQELYGSSASAAAQFSKAPMDMLSKPVVPNAEWLVDYSRNLYELMSDVQKDVTTVFTSHFKMPGADVVENVTNMMKLPVSGSDPFGSAMKQMFDTSMKAYADMADMAKHMSATGEASLKGKK